MDFDERPVICGDGTIIELQHFFCSAWYVNRWPLWVPWTWQCDGWAVEFGGWVFEKTQSDNDPEHERENLDSNAAEADYGDDEMDDDTPMEEDSDRLHRGGA